MSFPIQGPNDIVLTHRGAAQLLLSNPTLAVALFTGHGEFMTYDSVTIFRSVPTDVKSRFESVSGTLYHADEEDILINVGRIPGLTKRFPKMMQHLVSTYKSSIDNVDVRFFRVTPHDRALFIYFSKNAN